VSNTKSEISAIDRLYNWNVDARNIRAQKQPYIALETQGQGAPPDLSYAV